VPTVFKSQELTHAGSVVFREGKQGPEILLVTASDDPDTWVLPKGHIEAGEEPASAAVREVREEAGVGIEILAPLDVSTFHVRGAAVHVGYFLARATGDEYANSENRKSAWLPADRAFNALTHEDTKRALRLALAVLSKRLT
jgi:8-oxo-dGTP pyrophosphatase MutT (NUDIX family)